MSVGCQLDCFAERRLSVASSPRCLRLSTAFIAADAAKSVGSPMRPHGATYYQQLAPCAAAAPRLAHSSQPSPLLAQIAA